ncbi:putative N6-adenine methyltransferase-domain-containing protein [Tribonema minus]|uniref:Putative N6-adenine methyltransferase-domain-containing protein n=1 Tax=Tribonema minus TaxID=303371 RepID=A0A835YKM7_9STRA|nr:putative N6-adenine methyltransferase-domain-containing protein [Tribonema minus]
MASKNRFLVRNPEKGDLNQYWYSKGTIEALVLEVVEFGGEGTAFLSTPSIYFSTPAEIRQKCKVFDIDTAWKKDPGFVYFDFNKLDDVPADLHGTFAMVVIDPPFIMREVWEAYAMATAARLLLQPGGKILATTIAENEELMAELLDVKPCVFKPSIPHLVYQYKLYTNYDSPNLNQRNPEIPEDHDGA